MIDWIKCWWPFAAPAIVGLIIVGSSIYLMNGVIDRKVASQVPYYECIASITRKYILKDKLPKDSASYLAGQDCKAKGL